ncbi:-oxo-5-alpha-steroid 4-dehydrogenase 2-like, partial [Scomber scombrus]
MECRVATVSYLSWALVVGGVAYLWRQTRNHTGYGRSFIYAFLTRGRPVPLLFVLYAAIFCSINGFLQGHHLLHCARFGDAGLTDARLAA